MWFTVCVHNVSVTEWRIVRFYDGIHVVLETCRESFQAGEELSLKLAIKVELKVPTTYLFGGEVQVFPERQPEHVQIFTPVSERGQHVSKHLAILHVVGIYQYDAV